MSLKASKKTLGDKMKFETLEKFVENLKPSGIEIFVSELVAEDMKNIILMNIKKCHTYKNKSTRSSLINEIRGHLGDYYDIEINEEIELDEEKY